LAVGRYAYQKGYDMLLAAWAIVEKRCPEWELFIYGQGERKLYEEMVADLHLNNCHLKGSVSNIQEKYLDSSLFVISSRFEGLSMSLLEAMSFGLPVVSFACPCGFKDVISSGVDGVLVPEGNVELLAERIVDLINNPELRKEIGKNANVRSLDFKLEVLASRWKQLFENLY
jgi:glycosyltransferase involved in cell wall biosynthesis